MSKYFTDAEFKCSCCGKLPKGGMNAKLITILDAIRAKIGKPVTVLSGYRCPSHNAAVGGVSNSQHLYGIAADITYSGISVDLLAQVAAECHADGIGRYPSQKFVHVDVRGAYARWDG